MTCGLPSSRYADLIKIVRGVLRFDEPLSLHTTFRLGGPASAFIIPSCMEEALDIVGFADTRHLPVYVIGGGSNLLVNDSGIDGVVIKIAQPLDDISFSGSTILVGAGIKSAQLLAKCIKNQKKGLSFLAGIPGTLGGAVAMNAGTSGQAIGDFVKKAWLLDRKQNQWVVFQRQDFKFGYRKSLLRDSDRYVVFQVELEVDEGDMENEIQLVRTHLSKRKQTQPLQYPNAGCIWKNPSGLVAGKLIEDMGLKGYQKGGALVSNQHANFIVHHGRAKASDVYDLICLVEEKVYQYYGIQLEREIKFLGHFWV